MVEKGMGRREGRPGLLQAGEDRGRQRDPHARSGDARPTGRSSRRGCRRSRRRDRSRTPASGSRRCSWARTRSASSCARRSGRRSRYTARVAPDIAYSIDDVDRAMRWGFGWELGPFEIMEAIGMDGWPASLAVQAANVARRLQPGDLLILKPAQGPTARSSARTPARASSTSATACSRSSSTRR